MPVTGGEHIIRRRMRAIRSAGPRYGDSRPRARWRQNTLAQTGAMGEAHNIPSVVTSCRSAYAFAGFRSSWAYGRIHAAFDGILENMPVPVAGKMAPLDAPGHGLQLDKSAVARFKI